MLGAKDGGYLLEILYKKMPLNFECSQVHSTLASLMMSLSPGAPLTQSQLNPDFHLYLSRLLLVHIWVLLGSLYLIHLLKTWCYPTNLPRLWSCQWLDREDIASLGGFTTEDQVIGIVGSAARVLPGDAEGLMGLVFGWIARADGTP